jgi:hypothetical protein
LIKKADFFSSHTEEIFCCILNSLSEKNQAGYGLCDAEVKDIFFIQVELDEGEVESSDLIPLSELRKKLKKQTNSKQ